MKKITFLIILFIAVIILSGCTNKTPEESISNFENCEVWYDGCNTCTADGACTERYCTPAGTTEPYCKKYKE